MDKIHEGPFTLLLGTFFTSFGQWDTFIHSTTCTLRQGEKVLKNYNCQYCNISSRIVFRPSQAHSCFVSQTSPIKRKLKDTPKVLVDFKSKQKSVWSNVFWYVKILIFWKCIQYSINWDKTQMLNIFTVLLLISDSYMSCSTRLVYLKVCVGFSIFESVSFLLKFVYFFSTECVESMILKRHSSFQNWNKKTTQSFAPRLLIFKL